MSNMNIEKIREIISNSDNVIITQHSVMRFRERGIKYADIISALNNGTIIEHYPNDYPNPSCLVLGLTINGKYLHVVCGTDNVCLWIITAYFPSSDKWYPDFKTRKEH